jgi:FlaA1/EpsC-like NDP-sugar epimerase
MAGLFTCCAVAVDSLKQDRSSLMNISAASAVDRRPSSVEGSERERFAALLRGRTIVITGAAGSIGHALLTHVCSFESGEIRILDNNETELFFVEEAACAHPVKAMLGDVRDRDALVSIFKGADLVFHTAALKHVPLCERRPLEAVQTCSTTMALAGAPISSCRYSPPVHCLRLHRSMRGSRVSLIIRTWIRPFRSH